MKPYLQKTIEALLDALRTGDREVAEHSAALIRSWCDGNDFHPASDEVDAACKQVLDRIAATRRMTRR
jgi:hypothetical protein